MNSADKILLGKILKIAEKQNKILAKLAQTIQEDVEATKNYLKGAWETAALNSGVTPTTSPDSIEYAPGGASESNPNVTVSSIYTVTGKIPENLRMQFKNTFEKQIATQKPELDGRVGIIFTDPQ